MADLTGTGQAIGTLLTPVGNGGVEFDFQTVSTITVGRVVIGTTTSRRVIQASAAPAVDTDLPSIGVATETRAGTSGVPLEITIAIKGIVIAEAGADATLFQWLTVDASGRVISGTSGMPGTGTTVTAGNAGSSVDGITSVGILVLKSAAASAGDGVGVLLK